MAEFDYKGNLEGLNYVHLDYVSKVFKERGFKPSTVTVEQVGKLGDNYQANVKRFIVEGFRMIAKIAINSELLRETMSTALNFQNEVAMYGQILPKFSAMLKEVGVTDRLRVAECYGTFSEEPNEIILLEDLSSSDYKVLNRLEPLPVAAVDRVMVDLAALHGMSYVLKKKNQELFNTFCQELKSVWNDVDERFAAAMEALEGDLLKLIDSDSDKYKEKVKGTLVKQPKWTTKLEEDDIKYGDATVIVQGDAWTNNLMFKYEEGQIESLIMIDYQISRQSNPVLDLTYHIYNCTVYEMRAKHFQRWLDLYHAELTRITSLFGVDVNEFLSREDLDRNLKRYAKSSLGISLMFNTFVLKESEEVFDFKKEFGQRTDLNMEDFMEMANTTKLNERSMFRLKDRLNGLIKSYEDLGYFEDDVWGICKD